MGEYLYADIYNIGLSKFSLNGIFKRVLNPKKYTEYQDGAYYLLPTLLGYAKNDFD